VEVFFYQVRGQALTTTLVFIQVFLRHIVFGHLTGTHSLFVTSVGLFNSGYHSCLERVPLFEQFVHTLRIGAFNVGQTLKISRFLA
jgi:hypothetical protein